MDGGYRKKPAGGSVGSNHVKLLLPGTVIAPSPFLAAARFDALTGVPGGPETLVLSALVTAGPAGQGRKETTHNSISVVRGVGDERVRERKNRPAGGKTAPTALF